MRGSPTVYVKRPRLAIREGLRFVMSCVREMSQFRRAEGPTTWSLHVARAGNPRYSRPMDQQATINRILSETKTIAVVGFSSNPAKAGYYVPAYLKGQGYGIFPVNPNLTEGLGRPAYPALSDVPESVDLVLIFQRSQNVPPFVDQAIAIGAKAVWMQLGIAHAEAAARAEAAGLAVVQDACMLVEHKHWRRED